MAGAAAQNQQSGKAENIRRAAPVLLALLAEHRERKDSDAIAAHGASDNPAVTLVGPRGDIERRAS